MTRSFTQTLIVAVTLAAGCSEPLRPEDASFKGHVVAKTVEGVRYYTLDGLESTSRDNIIRTDSARVALATDAIVLVESPAGIRRSISPESIPVGSTVAVYTTGTEPRTVTPIYTARAILVLPRRLAARP